MQLMQKNKTTNKQTNRCTVEVKKNLCKHMKDLKILCFYASMLHVILAPVSYVSLVSYVSYWHLCHIVTCVRLILSHSPLFDSSVTWISPSAIPEHYLNCFSYVFVLNRCSNNLLIFKHTHVHYKVSRTKCSTFFVNFNSFNKLCNTFVVNLITQ